MSKKIQFDTNSGIGPSKTSKINEAEGSLDDLPQLEYEGENEGSRKERLPVQPSMDSITSQPSREKISIHLIKVAILFVIWLIYATAIVTHKEKTFNPILMGIRPQTTKRLEIPEADEVKQLIGIYLMGAFREGNDAITHKPNRNEPHVSLHLELVEGDLVEVISESYYFLLSSDQNLQYRPIIKKSLVMTLQRDISTTKGHKYIVMDTNVAEILTLKLWFDTSPLDKSIGIPLGSLVLLFLYILIIWEFVNRTFAAVVASTLAIGILAALNARPSILTIMSWVDVETLMLLFGMMILVSILSESGIFDYLAVLAYELSKGNLFGLIYVLCLFTAVLSAFLDNVTMMLLVAPVTIRLCEVCNLNPVPVLMSMVIYSNIGAALTPVGDPPNILIMTNAYINTHGVNFGNFCLHMLPAVTLGMISTFIHLRLKYPQIKDFMNKQSVEIEALKHEIQVWEKAAQAIAPTTTDEEIVQNTLHKKAKDLKHKLRDLEAKAVFVTTDFQTTLVYMKNTYSIRNKVLLIKSTVAFIFVLFLFCLHAVPHLHHLSLGWSALVGAILLLILADEEDIETVLSRVEWSTLLFFACLFTLMESLTELGLIEVLGNLCVKIISTVSPTYRLLVAVLLILWVSGIASAILANIPVTTMMVKIVISLAQNDALKLPLTPLVWALALGACFGGNGTLIGASANVVSSGVAEQHGYRISFLEFFFFGFPIMINTLIVASIYLFLAHCLWQWH
ncbi:P protein-like [Musca vetustissima]|uniref:P protein-like n=1 Tax=Musca vetustissima TaxID=27455 RepID=UPI002AB60CD1|nr:P protein-like [Musca vetustissima]